MTTQRGAAADSPDRPVAEFDLLDRQLAQALMIDGRASFSRLAEVLGVSDQTVTRRYRRLRGEGLLRVIGLPLGSRVGLYQSNVRVQCVPGAAGAIADALARRRDIGWVTINASGTEVSCMTRSRSRRERDLLLLDKLPRTRQVTGVSVKTIMHVFVGGPGGWPGLAAGLGADQAAALHRDFPAATGEFELDDADHALLAVLARDGRAPYPELAAAVGKSESTVRRRVEHLTDSGVLYFDVEVLPIHLGFHVEAMLTAAVAPADLDAAGRAVGSHPEVPFAAATTGPTNLAAVVVCREIEDLYEYLTGRVGAIKGIGQLEVVQVLRTVKRAGLLTDGVRLYDPPEAVY
ncbi:DNA-binding Lrp family transcriptional regulator [Catenulispora sp. GP43]|uniref:Lrp/AsnC family transcriptional regulator n=1 Tax=Catenulispora sp. GP43 TaxID=3156263 RepID=UPI0035115B1E